jgi:peptidoglycan/LPS O-acetylase OafA/YrhL
MDKRPPSHHLKYDMLRGVASIAVLLGHLVQTYLERLMGPDSVIVLVAENVARHAVLVFFLLSGYLITQSISSNLKRNGHLDVRDYLAARIVRIYPPLVGAIFVILAIWIVINILDLPGRQRYGLPGDLYTVRASFVVSFKDVIRTLVMQNGLLDADGPLWSLYMEFHIYLIAMFTAMTIGTGRRFPWGGMAILLVVVWVSAAPSFAFFASVWALGAAAALAKRGLAGSRAALISKLLIYPIIATLLVIAVIAPRWLAVENRNYWVAYGVQIACCLVYVELIFLTDGIAARPPDILVKTGHFSYSLYVLHFPFLLLILSLTQTWMGASIARSLVVTIAAAVSVTAVAAWFAKFFEDQRRFQPLVKVALNSILPAARSARGMGRQ